MPANDSTTAEGRLSGKFALVTGGASGIGQATALLFAREGAVVAVADLNEQCAEATANSIRSQGGQASAYHLDVTDEAAWDDFAATLLRAWPRLDVVVNSAGVAFSKQVADMSLAEWERVLAANLTGVFLGTRFAIRAMKSQRRGNIVNVSSTAGLRAIPGASAYCVSKTAVCMLTRVAARECAQNGWQIRVNAVLPGGVKTPIWRQLDFWEETVNQWGGEEEVWHFLGGSVPLRRYAEPEEVARAILYLISDEAAYVTGTGLVIDGGYTA
jgi:NAD(P)-dependent dehydrogenase (short-subunit alcohol dehydrogenase family)